MGGGEETPAGRGKAVSCARPPFPSAQLQEGPERTQGVEDGQSGILFLVSGQWASRPAGEKGLEPFFLRLGGDEQLLVSKVPPGRHVECHVGQDNSVLQDGKDGIHSSLTVHIVPKVDSQRREEGDEVDDEEPLFPVVGLAVCVLLGQAPEDAGEQHVTER